MPSFAIRNYYGQGGFQFAEQFGNESRRDYLIGAPASVIGLADQTGARTDRTRYRAYGEQSSRSGTYAQALSWNGAVGYRSPSTLNSVFNNTYVRARHYSPEMHMWTTRDPAHRQTGDSYSYVSGMPMRALDPSGLQAGTLNHPWPNDAILIEANQFINRDAFGDYIPVTVLAVPVAYPSPTLGGPTMYGTVIYDLQAGSDHRRQFDRVVPGPPDWEYAGKSRIYSAFALLDRNQLGKPIHEFSHVTASEIRWSSDAGKTWDSEWQRAEFTLPSNKPGPIGKDLSDNACTSSIEVSAHATATFWRILKPFLNYSFAGNPVTIDWTLRVTFGKGVSNQLAYKIEGTIEAFPDYEFLATTESGKRVLRNIYHVPAKYGRFGSAKAPWYSMNPFRGLNEAVPLATQKGVLGVKVKCCAANKNKV